MSLSDRNVFESAYAGKAPWDIDGPQPNFVSVAGKLTGSLLDCGCGTGENSLYFAGLGRKVTGIDFLAEPIARAKAKAAKRGLAANFLVMDALALNEIPELYDASIDSGLFHVFNDADRQRYIAGLATVLKPGGQLFVLCFSDGEPGEHGPRRITKQEIFVSFNSGWTVQSIEPTRFAIRPDFTDIQFSDGGPHAWFASITRNRDAA